MVLNVNERRVLEAIQKDPFISQQDLAEDLAMPRSTVASIISSLIDKHVIQGRGYILHEEKQEIFCIGGMNIDRKYTIIGSYQPGTSNPVHSSVYVGGVVRNVAENLGRLGQVPQMISVAGEDSGFDFIKNQSEPYVLFDYVKQDPKASTGSYSAILDHSGEMKLALADMDIYDHMDGAWIRSFQPALEKARLIAVDLNVSYEVMEFLIPFARDKGIDLVVIPVSGPKMAHLPRDLEGVTWLIVNLDESEAFFERQALTEADVHDLALAWLDLGVENLVLTRGKDPTVVAQRGGSIQTFQPPVVDEVVDVTGAGDSYSSAIIYGHLMGLPLEETIHLAMTNSYYTIQAEETVRTDLTADRLSAQMKDLFQKG